MKKAFAVFAVCLLLAAGAGLFGMNLLHEDRDQVEVTAATLSGDPAAAEGLVATQAAHLNDQLRWDLTIPLDRPEESTAETTKTWTTGQTDSPGAVSIYANVPSSQSYLMSAPSPQLPDLGAAWQTVQPLLQAIADRTEAGQTHTETLRLADHCTVYPFSVELRLPYTADLTEDLDRTWQDFFAFPVPADETWTVTVQKSTQGNLQKIDMEVPATYAPNFLSAYARDRVFFTLDGSSSGACVNAPGGFGLYALGQTVDADGQVWAEADALFNVFPLSQGTEVVDLSATPDGQYLLLTTCQGQTCTLRLLHPETMEVLQTLPVPENTVSAVRVEETCLLLWNEDRFHLYSLAEGRCTYAFSAPMEPDLLRGIDYLAAAWNGETLALSTVSDPETFTPGLTVTLYRAGEQVYQGQYTTSLTDETATIRLLPGHELALTWT